MGEYKIAQLTKELVAYRLKGMQDPGATTATVVRETLGVALRGPEAQREGAESLIEQACRGALTAVLLGEKDLARSAVLILEVVAEVAEELELDPTEAMGGAIRGIADLRRFVQDYELQRVGREIEARFMGAGEALIDAVRKASEADASGITTS